MLWYIIDIADLRHTKRRDHARCDKQSRVQTLPISCVQGWAYSSHSSKVCNFVSDTGCYADMYEFPTHLVSVSGHFIPRGEYSALQCESWGELCSPCWITINMYFDRFDSDAADLFSKLLHYDKDRRIIAQPAMSHPYFNSLGSQATLLSPSE